MYYKIKVITVALISIGLINNCSGTTKRKKNKINLDSSITVNSIEISKDSINDIYSINNPEPITVESSMETLIKKDYILIRSKFNSEKDIVYKYLYNNTKISNGNYIGYSVYIIPNNIKLGENIEIYLVHNINDSISALGTEQYWFILGQHGYYIPKATIINNKFKIGQKVINELNDEFKIIDIENNEVYLAPTIVTNGKTIDRKWKSGTKFKKLSKPDGSEKIEVQKVSGYQIRPMLKKNSQKVFIDGKEIKGYGLFSGKSVELLDDFDCINPIGATFKDKNSMFGNSLLNLKQSFYFEGNSTYLSSTIKMKDWLPFIKYHGIQPMGLKMSKDKNVFFMFPKVKPQPESKTSKAVDWNYPTDVSEENETTYSKYFFKANSSDLKNKYDLTDRVIQFQKSTNSNQFGIGFAAGLDLINGVSAKGNREKYTNEAFALSGNLSNKVYFRTLTNSQFPNGILPKGFSATINAYYAYFLPEDGLQTYVVNTKTSSYIYINTQKKFNNKSIRINNSLLNNKVLSIVEQNGIILNSNSIKNNRISFSTNSATSSYVVLKTN